jgi:hypothetical protein
MFKVNARFLLLPFLLKVIDPPKPPDRDTEYCIFGVPRKVGQFFSYFYSVELGIDR